jgi:hypothetical protein
MQIDKKQIFENIIKGTLNASVPLKYNQLIDFVLICLATTPRNYNKIAKLLKFPEQGSPSFSYKKWYRFSNINTLRTLSKIYKFNIYIEFIKDKQYYKYSIHDINLFYFISSFKYNIKAFKDFILNEYRHNQILTYEDPVLWHRAILKHCKYCNKYNNYNGLQYYALMLQYLECHEVVTGFHTSVQVVSTTPLYNQNVISQLFN